MNITYFNLAFCGYFFAAGAYLIVTIFKRQNLSRSATIIFVISFVSHTACILERWLAAKRPPFVGMYESLLFFSWAIALVYLLIQKLKKAGPLSAALSLSVVLLLGASSLLDRSVKPMMPALKSNWLVIHAVSYFIAYAGMAISFLASIGYLFQKSLNSSLAADLDSLSFRLVAFSFPFLTIGLTSGSVWAKLAWGAYWSWDPKETWALISWSVYAIYLHQPRTRTKFGSGLKNWQGRKAAYLNILGFLSVLFTFFAVNYFLKGLHSYL